MRLYFDLCALKRPFDRPLQDKLVEEQKAVVLLLEEIEQGHHTFAWSSALTYENERDQGAAARTASRCFGQLCEMRVGYSAALRQRVAELRGMGLKGLDGIHLAMAEAARCHVLVTCDDRFVKRASHVGSSVRVLNPIELWEELRHAQRTDGH